MTTEPLEPDYEAIVADRQAERDELAMRRADARYGRVEDYRKPPTQPEETT